MRDLLATLVLFTINILPAHAQTAEKCEGLDLNNAKAIVACLESDEIWFAARTKPQFNPNKKCSSMQLLVLKTSLSATDPRAAKRINPKTFSNSDISRPSCETLSNVVEIIHGYPASWSPCMGYDEAQDKFEHFKFCLLNYEKLRYGQPDRKTGNMDCKRALATYQKALGQVYPPRQDQGEYYGRTLPPTYSAPDCAQVEAFFKVTNEVEMAAFQKRNEEEMTIKAQKKAEKGIKAKEAAERAKRAQESQARMDESFQNSLDEMSQPALTKMKNEVQPSNEIVEENIRNALIREVWGMVPERRHDLGTTILKVVHTTAGYKSWTNNKMAPNIYHAVKNAKIEKCDIGASKAHCTYDVTVSTSLDYHGIQDQQQKQVYNKLGDISGGGPRTFTLESDFVYDGKKWKASLTRDQEKLLLPPEVKYDVNQATKNREKMNCDIMSAMGVPMMC